MAEEKKATKKSKVVAGKKIIKEQAINNKLRRVSIITILSPKILRWAQGVLLFLFLVAFLIFIFVVLLLAVGTDLATRQIEALSASAGYSGFALFFISIISAFIGFLNINIRSKAEQEEERVRREVRKIDLELEELDYYIREWAGPEEREDLGEQYRKLNRERDLLISQSSQFLERVVFTNWGKVLIESRKRLLKEEERLEARNAANLVYGVSAAGVGMIFFIFVGGVSYYEGSLQEVSFEKFPFYYLLTLPVVIISEVVAIFFLRLFAQTEKSIERNKNEMTNIELRLTASQLLSFKGDKTSFDSLADDLAKEERNFVLKKNESSSEFDIDRAVEIATKVISAGTK